SALVVAESDAPLARREANRLAAEVWRVRTQFGPDVETATPEEAVARALASTERPVFISDSGDNVTAGGAGDSPLFLRPLLEAGATNAIAAGLADAEAVAACCQAGIGGTVSLSLGGKIDAVNAAPYRVTGTVRHCDPADAPNLAAVDVGGVRVILTAKRWP